MEQQSSSAPNLQPTPNQTQDEPLFAGLRRETLEDLRSAIVTENPKRRDRQAATIEVIDRLVDRPDDPSDPKYVERRVELHGLLTASDRKFEKLVGQNGGAEQSKAKLDDTEIPTIGDIPLAELKAIRQRVHNNPTERTAEINVKFPTPKSNDPDYNRKFDARQKYSELLKMDDDKFKKEAASWEKRAARNAKKEAKRNERASSRRGESKLLDQTEVAALRGTGDGLVGRFVDTGWDVSDLDVAREYHEAVQAQGADKANAKAVKDLIKDKVNLINHATPADKHNYATRMVGDLTAFAELDDLERLEVEAALAKYQNNEQAAAEKNERLIPRLRAKAVGGIALLGAGIARISQGYDENRKQMTAVLRGGASSLGAKIGSNEDQPNIFRRAHDWTMVEAGIRLTDAWDKFKGNNEQHAHETDEQYHERMLKTGKRTRNVVLGALMLYGASRVLPGVNEMFHGSGNAAAQHTDTITNVVVTNPSPSPTHTELVPGGAGGGHAILEQQGHSGDTVVEQSSAPSAGGGRDIEDWKNAGHAQKPEHISITRHIDGVNTYFSGHEGSTHFSDKGVDNVLDYFNNHKVTKGENAWNDLATKYLQHEGVKDPTKFQIDAVKDRLVPELQRMGVANSKGELLEGAIIKRK